MAKIGDISGELVSPAANEGERWGQFAAGLDQGPLTLMNRW